jgi:hypothetical protein
MGLIIKSTAKKKIQSQGYDGQITELESVYARLEFACRPNGTTVESAFPYIFLSKEAFKLNAPTIPTDVPTSASGEVLEQSMLTAHEVASAMLVKEGYEVVIDLV